MALTLDSPIRDISRTVASRHMGTGKNQGPEADVVLADSMGIHTVGELLHHYPRTYIDRGARHAVRRLVPGRFVTVIGHVHRVYKTYTRRTRQSMVKVTIKENDGRGTFDLTFFNQPWLATTYAEGTELAVSGLVTLYQGRPQFARQEIEVLRTPDQEHVHTLADHARPQGQRGRQHPDRPRADLPRVRAAAAASPTRCRPRSCATRHLGSYDRALRDIHFPADDAALDVARERLKFDELFMLELGVAFRKHRAEADQQGVAHDANGELTDRLMATIPFEPTDAQTRAIAEIGAAMARATPMNVLLQGDVGAGKTLVALHACLIAIGSGHQAAIMAPTEVLAGQHYRSIDALLQGVGAVPYLDLVASAPAPEGSRAGVAPGAGTRAGRRGHRRGLDHLRDAHRRRDRQGPDPDRSRASRRATSTSSSGRTRSCRRACRSRTCRSRWSTSSIGSGCTSARR